MSKNKIYFKNLDSIRFIAAMMVYLGHGISPSYRYLPIKNTFLEKLLMEMSCGGTGVSIFFVLSGFLITYLLITEYELNSEISLKNFYIRRVLRIWPLYYLVVIFSFFLYPGLKSLIGVSTLFISNIFYHLTFLSNFDVIRIQTFYNGMTPASQNITWSVSIEEQFYLFWPLIFVFLPKRSWLISILMVIFTSLIFRILNNNNGIVLYFHTLSVLIDLGIGGLMALLIKKSVQIRNVFENSSTRLHLFFFIISFCLVFWAGPIFSFKYGNTVARLFISFSFAFIICAQAVTKSASGLNLGNWSFANRWGKYTYGIYLIHPIALTIINAFVRVLHIPDQNFTCKFSMGIIGFFLTLLLSKMSFIYFESKFLKIKDKFTVIKTR